jgi:nucleotide-binding universal stress UspA family protein
MEEARSMSYKTILVHLNDERRAEAILEPAVRLAARYNSHLTGLHVDTIVAAPPLSLTGLGPVAAEKRGNGEAVAALFARMTTTEACVAELQRLKVPQGEYVFAVLEHGRTADLIVAGQADPDRDLSPVVDFPERLALESGRPVLVIPYVGRYPQIGRSVVIAWKAGRETTRAIFDALPLLKGAENVHILEVTGRADEKTLGTDTSIAASLARHGVKPTIRTSVAPDISVGDEILSRLSDLDADLLVMGAYGHSRMRELVFGGVTRHIARHMTVPTLFSH